MEEQMSVIHIAPSSPGHSRPGLSFPRSTQDSPVSSRLTCSPGLSPSAPPWLVASSFSVPQFPPLPSAHTVGAAVKS